MGAWLSQERLQPSKLVIGGSNPSASALSKKLTKETGWVFAIVFGTKNYWGVNMIEEIISDIEAEIQARIVGEGKVKLEFQKDSKSSKKKGLNKGDLSTSIALELAGWQRKNPITIATGLIGGINNEYVSKVDVVNGYINISLDWNKISKMVFYSLFVKIEDW